MGRKTVIIAGALSGAAYYLLGFMFCKGSVDVMSWTEHGRVGLVLFAPFASAFGALAASYLYSQR